MYASAISSALDATKCEHQVFFEMRNELIKVLENLDVLDIELQNSIDFPTKEIETLNTIISDLSTQLDVLDAAVVLKESDI
jgi:hypothetical protein